MENARIAGSETASEMDKRVKEQQKKFNDNANSTTRNTDLDTNLKAIAEEKKKLEGEQDAAKIKAAEDAIEAAEAKIAGVVAKMPDEEFLALSDTQLNDPKISKHFSPAQIKTLQDSGRLDNAGVKKVKGNRENGIYGEMEKVFENINASAEDLEKAMKKLEKATKSLSKEELESMDAKRLASEAVASQLSEKQLDILRDSGKFSPAQISDIQTARTTGLANIANTGRVGAQTRKEEDGSFTEAKQAEVTGGNSKDFVKKQRENLFKKNAEGVGKLPLSAFASVNEKGEITSLTEAGSNITADALKAVARAANQGKATMSDDDRGNLAEALLKNPTLNTRTTTYLTSKKGQEDFLLSNETIGSIKQSNQPTKETQSNQPSRQNQTLQSRQNRPIKR